MSLEFGKLHRGVVTFSAVVRFLKCMTVAYVAHQLTRCSKLRITFFTFVRTYASMSVDVILKKNILS